MLAQIVASLALAALPCADDLAALPHDFHPAVYRYELVCHPEHITHPTFGPVLGYVTLADRTIHLWDDNPLPAGFVLAHEIGHLQYGHTPGQAGAEAEATGFAHLLVENR